LLRSSILLILVFLFVIFSGCGEKEPKSQFKTHKIDQGELGGKTVCPICGMEITISAQTPALEYKGQIYYFCTEDEKDQFMKNPEKLILKEEEGIISEAETKVNISEEELEASGYKKHKVTPEEIDQVALCPGCRMYLAVSSKTPALEKEGKIFYFCSQDCMAEFLRRKR
jgi:YHS domain-containing protein